MLEKSAFIEEPFDHRGRGFRSPAPHHPPVCYNADTTRYFPAGVKGTSHVPAAVVEDLSAESRIDIPLAAPSLLVDGGFMEMA